MRIAISSQDSQGLDGVVSQHFGRCPFYTFLDFVDDKIAQITVLPNPYFSSHQPGQVPAFIKTQGTDMLITGGMGRRAISLFEQYSIQTFTGATGTVREALEQALSGALPEAVPCAGHEGEHSTDHGHCQ